MACHATKGHSDCYQVLRLCVVKRQTLHDNFHLLPHSKYAAQRSNHTLQEKATCVEGKRKGRESGPIGVKGEGYQEDKKMKACEQAIKEQVVDKA